MGLDPVFEAAASQDFPGPFIGEPEMTQSNLKYDVWPKGRVEPHAFVAVGACDQPASPFAGTSLGIAAPEAALIIAAGLLLDGAPVNLANVLKPCRPDISSNRSRVFIP